VFEGLADKIHATLSRLGKKGKLSEHDVDEALREVRLALLEADVNFKVVKEFLGRVRERAIGAEVMQSLSPAQQVVKIVHEELVHVLGDKHVPLQLEGNPPVIMLVGLQGSGKTTTAGKLAGLLKKQGRRPLLVALDLHRPAAVQQLKVLGAQLDVPVFALEGAQGAVEICNQAIEAARQRGLGPLVLDTAGRLHIDEEMMKELEEVRAAAKPAEVLLVVDAMTGQDAVNVAREFHACIGLTGILMTKLDGDTRGGAALSARSVTGVPIKLVGVGERLDALEPFYPERVASRILGMGDVLTLIEKAQQTMDIARAQELERKVRSASFDLEDFLDQLRQVRKMGPFEQLLDMIPGVGSVVRGQKLEVDERHYRRLEAIILSMTPEERRNPEIIGGSRRRRIARGSGTTPQQVNALLNQFFQLRRIMKTMSHGRIPKGWNRLGIPGL
jgi:signal recognition particle subunit SRP54